PISFRLTTWSIALLFLFLQACNGGDPGMDEEAQLNMELTLKLDSLGGPKGIRAFMLPNPTSLEQIPQDPRNPLNTEKILLGKHLFHETGLGVSPLDSVGMYSYSCASCHHVVAGFQAGRQQGIGEGGKGFGLIGEGRVLREDYNPLKVDVQPMRSPSALNVAYQTNMLWNGQFGATGINAGTEAQWTSGTPKEVNNLGFEGVETQAIAGLQVHRQGINYTLLNEEKYKNWFDKAFYEIEETRRLSIQNIGLAIAAYERTLLPKEAPFQRWLSGDQDAMTLDEKKGALLFFGKGECGSCHKGPALNEMAFYGYGMKDMEGNGTIRAASSMGANLGRGDFTKNPEDNYKFKVPQLYNLKDSPFYGHGGTFQSVHDVVAYKNTAIAENPNVPTSQLAEQFAPLNLTEEEVDLITLFIEDALYDDNLDRYVPDVLPSGNCFPNADQQSKSDLGCD
ncbi:MAG: cytochrome c peroxidase, partial [Bacteroidota bacterium]